MNNLIFLLENIWTSVEGEQFVLIENFDQQFYVF